MTAPVQFQELFKGFIIKVLVFVVNCCKQKAQAILALKKRQRLLVEGGISPIFAPSTRYYSSVGRAAD
jgi:hypothetical protein